MTSLCKIVCKMSNKCTLMSHALQCLCWQNAVSLQAILRKKTVRTDELMVTYLSMRLSASVIAVRDTVYR